MRQSASDKWHILLPGALLLTVYLIFYNMVGNDAANHQINYADKIATPLDQKIPFIPIFLIFYIFTIIYPLISIAYLLKHATMHVRHFYRIYFTALLLISVSSLLWLNFPTHFPFRATSAEIAAHGFWGSSVGFAYQYITSWNACPSFHIAISWFILRIMHLYLRKNLWLFQVLFFAIALSTLFIRIHFVADIFFGILIAELAFQVLRYMEKKQVFEQFSKRKFLYYYLSTILLLASLFLMYAKTLVWIPSS